MRGDRCEGCSERRLVLGMVRIFAKALEGGSEEGGWRRLWGGMLGMEEEGRTGVKAPERTRPNPGAELFIMETEAGWWEEFKSLQLDAGSAAQAAVSPRKLFAV